ncbi:HWE histidine kinase domain-containing protein [Roseobacter weihaiensis]|uniref:HWE histidine kinase domain-containing protein n=1 Tax=Roseobacter weihaiensis TaxID=2763262 RepID=UPI001D0BBD7D|nr:HWE histidine kinase domain-containing protein [Roseobacter sp. H9]
MNQYLTEDQLKEALDTCASEPVHIPGTVQPFACLVACTADLGAITHASENCEHLLGLNLGQLLGKDVEEVFGSKVCHQLRNAASRPEIKTKRVSLGVEQIGEAAFELNCFRSAEYLVLEIEPSLDDTFGGGDALETMGFLLPKLQNCKTQESLFDVTVDLIRHVTGFDRVMIYRFDLDFNGEVITEKRRSSMQSFLGLRFPNWDIPRQARDIMKKIPLRLISDVNQTPQRLMSAIPNPPALDITLAASRGVSEVHIEYLKNMGIQSTMTLNISVDDRLWGIISLHHRRPKVLAPKLRELLESFVPLFASKVLSLRQKETLERIRKLDAIVVNSNDRNSDAEISLAEIAPRILNDISAHGIASISAHKTSTFGAVPDAAVLQEILDWAQKQDGDVVATEALGQTFSEPQGSLRGCAGALVAKVSSTKVICVFRNETAREVAWAGSPEKRAEVVSGALRLSPRGSFSTYLEKVRGTSQAWSEDDIHFARHVRTLLHASETQLLLNKMNRQQSLMIDELNHRVRNILALVRSVSRQARRRYGSLNSYAAAMESRIRALAASHELSAGSLVDPVSVHNLIEREFEPYGSTAGRQTFIRGPDRNLRADIAPIFSLVIHELSTNAAKYGALSVDAGKIDIRLETDPEGMRITWKETGGPSVAVPNDTGFGTAMIEQAFPHEFGGTAQLTFAPDGVLAEFLIPQSHFDDVSPPSSQPLKPPLVTTKVKAFSGAKLSAPVLLLEDNFIIAREMKDQLVEFGAAEVEVFSNAADALDFLTHDEVSLGVLDINLGRQQTSAEVAQQLEDLKIPFIFVSGYSEHSEMPLNFPNVPLLTKPVSNDELQNLLASLFD